MAHVGTGTAGKVLTARGVTTQAGFKEIGTLSGLTDHGVLLGQGADPFVATAAGATGQVLTGVTGGDPIWAAPAVSNDYHDTRFIVGASAANGANYTTIASAITAAVAAGGVQNIAIQAGTYTENLTLPANINLVSYAGSNTPAVTIVGKITCTDAGTRTISGIRLQTNSDFVLVVSGSALTVVNLENCYLNCTNNTGISFTSSGIPIINLLNCLGDLGTTGITYFVSTSNGVIQFFNGNFGNTGNSVVPSSKDSNAARFYNTTFRCLLSCTETGSIVGNYSLFNMDVTGTGAAIVGIGITMTSTGTLTLVGCTIGGDSGNQAISIGTNVTAYIFDCVIESDHTTDGITGAASINYGNLAFVGTGKKINITGSQSPKLASNDPKTVVSPAAYPYTTVPQDNLILVDTSVARTITPLSGAATGQKHIIKDSVGSAATNNITITPSGKNIDGAASYTMNVAYGSVTIIYNGTEWSIC